MCWLRWVPEIVVQADLNSIVDFVKDETEPVVLPWIPFQGGAAKLDVLRIQELYADFYLSNDPASPGRFIAGPMEFE